MMEMIILKVYGHFWPADESLRAALARVCHDALPAQRGHDTVALANGLLSISFEGVCFPVDDCLDCLAAGLPDGASGRLDVLDMENWRMERHEFSNGRFSCRSAPLNDVLAHSGF